MSIFNTTRQTPLTFSLSNMTDIVSRLDQVDIYDINLFLLKHPNLANINRGDDQPNDITKLSLKMMSNYILNFGIGSNDPNLSPITVTRDQTFDEIYYIHDSEDDDIDERNSRPATLRDVFTEIKELVTTQVVETIIDSGFSTINSIVPDYLVSLDSTLATDKLQNLTQATYNELAFNDFMFIGSVSDYTPGTTTGLLEPSSTEILAAHTHANMLYSADLTTPAVTVKTSKTLGTDSGNSRILNSTTTNQLTARIYHWGDHASTAAMLTPNGMTKVNAAGTSLVVSGNIEDQLNANGIVATCLPNVVADVGDKLSIRYKARRYKIFEKQTATAVAV